MFSPIPFGFSKPNSCLILLFFFSYFHHLPCALSQPDLDPKFCDTLFHCGNITAGFPFWGAARPEPCGHPSLGLHCDQSKNVSLFIISGQMYRVLHIHIDNSTNTLGLARQDLLGETFCNSTLTGTTLTPELFELSPEYTTLFVYYLCEPHLPNPASFTCPQTGAAWVRQSNEIHENCAANYNITVSTCYVPEREAFNLTRLFSVLKEGFEVKLKIDKTPCQECKSTGGVCAYDRDTPVCCKTNSSSDIECSRMIPSVDESHQHCSPLFTCGNQIDLYYPFWTHDRAECGHPGFKVNCSNDGFAEFTTSSVKYRILEMNYTSSIIRLARMDYLDDLCPHSPENATLDQQVLPFSRDTEFLTFYYHCHGPRLDFPFNGHIRRLECEDDTGGQSFSVSSLFHIDVLRESCGRTVNIPVSRSALGKVEGNQSVEAVKKALREGFELNFNRDCSRCRKSDGACGYSQSLGGFVCYCIDGPHKHTCGQNGLSRNARIGIGFSCGFLGATLLVGGLLCFIVRRRKKLAARYTSKDLSTTSTYTTTNMGYRKRETSHHQRDHKLKALLQLKEYSYEEVKNITKSFSHTVGTGGFGTVYGGNLSNGRKVAVKVLKDFKSSGEDFINEVASMSQTSHVNIVSLLGFCYEGSKRAIVYEFLENGSLDQFISKKKSLSLSMSTLYGIALGVARGLEYLHHGCKTRIVHFDIKPQNILLDDDLCPKVSDFGLAKLCEKRESILSLLDTRGTVGYIAPEVFSGMYGRVSHKSDVYSYGMLVLEMIGARNKETVETAASNPSSTYFPDWIYKGLENEEHTWVIGYATTEEKEIAKKMILVGLWCIQPCPSNRPPMNRVFEMMAGSLDAIEVPPKPSLHLSPVPLSESPWLSEENSNYSEVLI